VRLASRVGVRHRAERRGARLDRQGHPGVVGLPGGVPHQDSRGTVLADREPGRGPGPEGAFRPSRGRHRGRHQGRRDREPGAGRRPPRGDPHPPRLPMRRLPRRSPPPPVPVKAGPRPS
jgi:hypothetical protein